MQDVFKKYHNNKLKQNSLIIVASIFTAFVVNLSLSWNVNSWLLQSNVLNSNSSELIAQQADVYIEKIDNNLYIKNTQELSDLNNFNTSLVYNPSVIKVIDARPSVTGLEILSSDTGEWISNISFYWENVVIPAWSIIATIETLKNGTQNSSLNLVNTNFQTWNWEIFKLSVSWIDL